MLLCLNKSAEHLYQTVARHRLIPASAAECSGLQIYGAKVSCFAKSDFARRLKGVCPKAHIR